MLGKNDLLDLIKKNPKICRPSKYDFTEKLLFYIEILKICGQISCEEYSQEEPPKQVKTYNTENQNITEPSTIISMLTQDEINNGELIKKRSGPKRHKFPSLENQDWKKVMVETEKVNK